MTAGMIFGCRRHGATPPGSGKPRANHMRSEIPHVVTEGDRLCERLDVAHSSCDVDVEIRSTPGEQHCSDRDAAEISHDSGASAVPAREWMDGHQSVVDPSRQCIWPEDLFVVPEGGRQSMAVRRRLSHAAGDVIEAGLEADSTTSWTELSARAGHIAQRWRARKKASAAGRGARRRQPKASVSGTETGPGLRYLLRRCRCGPNGGATRSAARTGARACPTSRRARGS
jgi:hypothetical protein